MKAAVVTLTFLIALFLFNPYASAQTHGPRKAGKLASVWINTGNYLVLGAEAGYFTFRQPATPLSFTIPYTVTDLSGQSVPHTLQLQNLVPLPRIRWNGGFGFQIGSEKAFVDFSYTTSNASENLSLGYGRNIHLRPFYLGKKEIFPVIEPSLTFQYMNFRPLENDHGNNFLYEFDNTNVKINILGHESDTGYNTGAGKAEEHYTTNTLDLYYYQRQCYLKPAISIGLHPLQHILHLAAGLGYSIPIYKNGGFKLLQNDKESLTGAQLIPLGTYSTVSYRGNLISQTPYSLRGFYMDLAVGLNISARMSRK